jgi:hypothetical protein
VKEIVLSPVPVVDLMARALTDKAPATVVEAAPVGAVLVEALLRPTFLRHSPGPESMTGLTGVTVVLMKHIIMHGLAPQARPEASVLVGLIEERCNGMSHDSNARMRAGLMASA